MKLVLILILWGLNLVALANLWRARKVFREATQHFEFMVTSGEIFDRFQTAFMRGDWETCEREQANMAIFFATHPASKDIS